MDNAEYRFFSIQIQHHVSSYVHWLTFSFVCQGKEEEGPEPDKMLVSYKQWDGEGSIESAASLYD